MSYTNKTQFYIVDGYDAPFVSFPDSVLTDYCWTPDLALYTPDVDLPRLLISHSAPYLLPQILEEAHINEVTLTMMHGEHATDPRRSLNYATTIATRVATLHRLALSGTPTDFREVEAYSYDILERKRVGMGFPEFWTMFNVVFRTQA
jgi:hypothetical protein